MSQNLQIPPSTAIIPHTYKQKTLESNKNQQNSTQIAEKPPKQGIQPASISNNKALPKKLPTFLKRNGFLIFAILYLIFPFDFDYIPFFGYADDTLLFIVELIRREIIARSEQA